jgi:hypothetical protein
MGIITLGSDDFIRVPFPAARMTTSNALIWGVYLPARKLTSLSGGSN